jgi:hypothetical protein
MPAIIFRICEGGRREGGMSQITQTTSHVKDTEREKEREKEREREREHFVVERHARNVF